MIQLNDELLLNLGSSIALGIVVIIISSIALGLYRKQKSRLLLYFFLAWAIFGAFVIANGVSTVIGDVLTYIISYAFVLPANIIFWFAFVDESMHESLGLKKTAIALIAVTFLATFVLLEPWTYDVTRATFTINADMDWWFLQIQNIVFCLNFIVYAYWSTITFKKAPPSLKKNATALFIFGLLMIFSGVIQFTGDTMLLLLQTILVVGVTLGTIIIIKKDPRIAHLLPYVVYRLIITSKNGPMYYCKIWANVDLSEEIDMLSDKRKQDNDTKFFSEKDLVKRENMDIDNDMLSGIISAVGTAIKGTIQKQMKTGAVSEIKMSNAIMLTEMKYSSVNIILLASKASKALKTALSEFGSDFTKKYYNFLYDKDGFPREIIDPREAFNEKEINAMVDQYFGMVPSFIELPPEKSITDPIADIASKTEPKAE